MNALVEISKRIELTNEAIGRIGQMIQKTPGSPGLLMNLETLESTHVHLQKEFEETAKMHGVEICSYRLFQDGTDRQPITGIGLAFINFQHLFSLIYDAVKRGQPKRIAHVSDEVLNETSLDFAYSFPGSVGVAFTIPSQVSLYGNYFEETIGEVFKMAKANNADQLKTFSRTLGVAPVRAMFKWADDLVKAGFGVDVKWKGVSNDRERLFVQKPELATLREAILATSEEHHEEFTLEGKLTGVDITSHAFRFEYKDGKKKREIRGHFISDAVSPAHPVKIPARYRATIRRTTQTNYSMEEDEIKNFLLRIETI